jgi:hypothetical protein
VNVRPTTGFSLTDDFPLTCSANSRHLFGTNYENDSKQMYLGDVHHDRFGWVYSSCVKPGRGWGWIRCFAFQC